MGKEIAVRVVAQRDPDHFHTITVDVETAWVSCSCGVNYPPVFRVFDGKLLLCDRLMCSHIDAVLVAGERAMVHPEDLEAANVASALVEGKIVMPGGWRGSWRRNMRWRGLSKGGLARPGPAGAKTDRRVKKGAGPMVCFTGASSVPRSELIEQAVQAGWEAIDRPSKHIDVLVTADPLLITKKVQVARESGVPIVSYDEWASVMEDGLLPE
ncbi:MAG TPA: hypothetical protein VFF98_17250 [Novosphingobium sp.]|nr:hypothetical protein [Novosphingobium sp.]